MEFGSRHFADNVCPPGEVSSRQTRQNFCRSVLTTGKLDGVCVIRFGAIWHRAAKRGVEFPQQRRKFFATRGGAVDMPIRADHCGGAGVGGEPVSGDAVEVVEFTGGRRGRDDGGFAAETRPGRALGIGQCIQDAGV